MDEFESLNHTKWECKYHVVFIPKCRIEEGHLMSDHVHMMIAIPPKYSVSQVIGYIKGSRRISCWLEIFGLMENAPQATRIDGCDCEV